MDYIKLLWEIVKFILLLWVMYFKQNFKYIKNMI